MCWSPYLLLTLWSVNNETIPVPYSVDLLTTLLAFANSSINPVIFTLLNRDFRNATKRIIRKLFVWKKKDGFNVTADTPSYSMYESEGANRPDAKPQNFRPRVSVIKVSEVDKSSSHGTERLTIKYPAREHLNGAFISPLEIDEHRYV